MTDVADDAERFEAFRRDLALRAARADAEHLATPGGFGLCDDCTFPIDAARLKAVPGATRCLHCQELAEARLRQPTR